MAPLPSGSPSFWWKVCCTYYLCSSPLFLPSLVALGFLSLSLAYSSLTVVCLGVGCVCASILLFMLCSLEFGVLLSFTNFGKFPAIVSSNSSVPLSVSLFLGLHICVCWMGWCYPTMFGWTVQLFFTLLLLWYSLKSLTLISLQVHRFLLQLYPTCWRDSQRNPSP